MKQHLYRLRKTLAIAICAVMICSTAVMIPDGAVPAGINAQAAESSGDFEYEITSDGSVCVTQYWGTDSSIIIPETIDGKPVEMIDDNAFAGSTVRTVYLPKTLKSIGKNAFINCYYLTHVYVPKGVTDISENALGYMDNGTNITTLTICGYSGSAAESYAQNNNLSFKAISDLINKSSLNRNKIYQTSKVSVTGNASGGVGPYLYAFSYKKKTDSTWTDIGTPFADGVKSLTTSLPSVGEYEIKAVVRDSMGEETTQLLDIDVVENMENVSTVSAERTDPGVAILAAGVPKNGIGPFKYTFKYKKHSGTNWIMCGETEQSENEQEIVISDEGTYDLRVTIKDSFSNSVHKNFLIYVSDSNSPVSNAKSSVSRTRIDPGEEITLKAFVENGFDPYTNAFYYKKADASEWTDIGDGFTDKTSVTFSSLKDEGQYIVRIVSKDVSGKTAEKQMKLNVSDSSKQLSNISEFNTSRVDPNETFTLSAKASGGTAPYQYSFYYKKSTDENWTLSGKAFQTEDQREFTFKSEGKYFLKTSVKDAEGTVESKEFELYVSDSSKQLANLASVSASRVDPDETVSVTASARYGCAPYTYSYYYRKDNTSEWTPSGEENTSDNISEMKFADEGRYYVLVKVKDTAGTVTDKTFTVYVSDSKTKLANNSEVSAERIDPNEAINVTANAAHGTAPYRYTFYYRKNNTGDWTRSGKEGQAENTREFKFVSEGTYGILVKIKDASGATASKNFVVYVSDSTQALVNNSEISAERVDPNEAINITANAAHGTAPYRYTFYYRKNNTGDWTRSGKEGQAENTRDIKFVSEGMYGILVKIKDARGTTISKSFIVYVSDSTAPITNLSEISTEESVTGETITLTGKAVGGTAPYTYHFEYKKASSSEWKTFGKTFQSSETATITFASRGSFDIRVTIKDANNNTAEKTFSVTVN